MDGLKVLFGEMESKLNNMQLGEGINSSIGNSPQKNDLFNH